jgi:hypothetical protein
MIIHKYIGKCRLLRFEYNSTNGHITNSISQSDIAFGSKLVSVQYIGNNDLHRVDSHEPSRACMSRRKMVS